VVVALVSVAVSASRFLHTAADFHTDYAGLSADQRESSIVAAAGLRIPTWEFVRQNVHATDRYIVRTPARLGGGFRRHVQTFAGYWLLPAVAVTSPRRAEVVVYLGLRAPNHAVCRESPEIACVQRLGS